MIVIVIVSCLGASLAAPVPTPYSCGDVYKASPFASNGIYTLFTRSSQPFQVYCEFHNNRGYTYISPEVSVDLDLIDLMTDRSHVIIRTLDTNGAQRYSRIEQSTEHADIPLSIQYDAYSGYMEPIHAAMKPYLYVGFLPINGIVHRGDIQGYKVNGRDVVFRNCDGSPNSYFAVMFNHNTPSVPPDNCSLVTTFIHQFIDQARLVTARDRLPDSFFSFFEGNFGGCGGYIDLTCTPNIQGASLGLAFDVKYPSPVQHPPVSERNDREPVSGGTIHEQTNPQELSTQESMPGGENQGSPTAQVPASVAENQEEVTAQRSAAEVENHGGPNSQNAMTGEENHGKKVSQEAMTAVDNQSEQTSQESIPMVENQGGSKFQESEAMFAHQEEPKLHSSIAVVEQQPEPKYHESLTELENEGQTNSQEMIAGVENTENQAEPNTQESIAGMEYPEESIPAEHTPGSYAPAEEVTVWTTTPHNAVVCPAPPRVKNAVVTPTGLTPGSIARYKCRRRYRKRGSCMIMCSDSGEWIGGKLRCVRRKRNKD